MESNITMSINLTSNVSSISIEVSSKASLVQSSTINLCVSVFSFASFIANGLILLVIGKTKAMHNKSQFVIFSHIFAETLYSLSAFAIAFRKYIFYLLESSEIVYQSTCMVMYIPQTGSSIAVTHFILALGLDRLLAVGKPIYYKTMPSWKYVGLLNLVCWGLSLVMMPFGFLEFEKMREMAVCQYSLAYSATFRLFQTYKGNVVAVATVGIYVVSLSFVGFRYWGTKWMNEAQRTSWSRKVNLGAFKIMMVVGVLYLVCWGLSQTISTTLAQFGPTVQATFGPYLNLLNLTNTLSHFFVCIGLSKRFRDAFIRLIRCTGDNTTTVQSIA